VRYWNPGEPTELRAWCTPEQASELTAFDHHVVEVDGQRGIMLTYHWWGPDGAPVDGERLELVVLTNPIAGSPASSWSDARRAVDGHPDAPVEVQRIVSQLTFRPQAAGSWKGR